MDILKLPELVILNIIRYLPLDDILKLYNTNLRIYIEEYLFKNNSIWTTISFYHTLCEEFIFKFKDKVIWKYISCRQKLSEKFIRENKDKVSWYYITRYQNISPKFILEFNDRVDHYYLDSLYY